MREVLQALAFRLEQGFQFRHILLAQVPSGALGTDGLNQEAQAKDIQNILIVIGATI